MDSKKLRIVYMGTPDFAVAPLRRLVETGYHVVGVVTMPDKPAGRGHESDSDNEVRVVDHSLARIKFLLVIACAVYRMDPSELGFQFQDAARDYLVDACAGDV